MPDHIVFCWFRGVEGGIKVLLIFYVWWIGTGRWVRKGGGVFVLEMDRFLIARRRGKKAVVKDVEKGVDDHVDVEEEGLMSFAASQRIEYREESKGMVMSESFATSVTRTDMTPPSKLKKRARNFEEFEKVATVMESPESLFDAWLGAKKTRDCSHGQSNKDR